MALASGEVASHHWGDFGIAGLKDARLLNAHRRLDRRRVV
jgi:hypothetical protein